MRAIVARARRASELGVGVLARARERAATRAGSTTTGRRVARTAAGSVRASMDSDLDSDSERRRKKTEKRMKKSGKPYPESRSVMVRGERYRRCACAVVFDDRGMILVGERSDRPGSWNMPQGGIEKNESLEDAASRELYEETGIMVGKDGVAELVGALPEDDGYAYRVDGASWLADRGLAGQRLEFCLFRWRAKSDEDARAMEDPSNHPAVNLSGLNGETREFERLDWKSFDDVVASVWPSKRAPYELMRDVAAPIVAANVRDQS